MGTTSGIRVQTHPQSRIDEILPQCWSEAFGVSDSS
jgi:hypothetical protein